MNLIDTIENEQLKKDAAKFKVGDSIRVQPCFSPVSR